MVKITIYLLILTLFIFVFSVITLSRQVAIKVERAFNQKVERYNSLLESIIEDTVQIIVDIPTEVFEERKYGSKQYKINDKGNIDQFFTVINGSTLAEDDGIFQLGYDFKYTMLDKTAR